MTSTFIILATITPDTHCPAGSNWLEAKLGCTKAVSFDITAACSGFIFSHVADKMIKSGANKTALVIGAEIMTRVVNWKEGSCIALGRWSRGGSSHGERLRAQVLSACSQTEKTEIHFLCREADRKQLPFPERGQGDSFLQMIEASQVFQGSSEPVCRSG